MVSGSRRLYDSLVDSALVQVQFMKSKVLRSAVVDDRTTINAILVARGAETCMSSQVTNGGSQLIGRVLMF